MTIEEKLNNFRNSCMTDARNRADKIIEDHKAAMEQAFEEHKKNETRRIKMHIKTETEKINRAGNKELALEHIKLRRIYGIEQSKLKEDLFAKLRERIVEFMKTDKYLSLIRKQIESAIEFSGDDTLQVYIDPNDIGLKEILEADYSKVIVISEYSFLGGTRAVIPEKNILIDNSFEKKLSEAMAEYQFDIGGNNNE